MIHTKKQPVSAAEIKATAKNSGLGIADYRESTNVQLNQQQLMSSTSTDLARRSFVSQQINQPPLIQRKVFKHNEKYRSDLDGLEDGEWENQEDAEAAERNHLQPQASSSDSTDTVVPNTNPLADSSSGSTRVSGGATQDINPLSSSGHARSEDNKAESSSVRSVQVGIHEDRSGSGLHNRRQIAQEQTVIHMGHLAQTTAVSKDLEAAEVYDDSPGALREFIQEWTPVAIDVGALVTTAIASSIDATGHGPGFFAGVVALFLAMIYNLSQIPTRYDRERRSGFHIFMHGLLALIPLLMAIPIGLFGTDYGNIPAPADNSTLVPSSNSTSTVSADPTNAGHGGIGIWLPFAIGVMAIIVRKIWEYSNRQRRRGY